MKFTLSFITLIILFFTGCAKEPCVQKTQYNQNMLQVVGSFNLDDKDKEINASGGDSNFSLDDFLLVKDKDYVYILDLKSGKEVGKLDRHEMHHNINISSDTKGHATINYIVTSKPTKGDTPFMPGPPIQIQLVYIDGVYREKERL